MQAEKPLEVASLDSDKTPHSKRYNDFYYSSQDGLLESEYNYIQGNDLYERFRSHKGHFCIGELGFGTGLNFLLTADAWVKHGQDKSDQSKKLYYVGFEKHPVLKEDLEKLYQQWPQFGKVSTRLLKYYPKPFVGFYLITFAELNIDLLIVYGDVNETMAEVQASIDAWYLDGFSPSKNPDMWSDMVFKQIARLSYEQTTLSSFSSASNIRHKAESIHMQVNKRAGFGKKREMIIAKANGLLKVSDPQPAWGVYPVAKPVTKVAVVGSGIAGATLAYSLARQGVSVVLFEKHHDIVGASAVTMAATHLFPSTAASIKREFDLGSSLYAIQCLDTLFSGSYWDKGGLSDSDTFVRQEKLFNVAGFKDLLSIDENGKTYYPSLGKLCPKSIIKTLINHPNIETRFCCEVTDYQYDGAWKLSIGESGAFIDEPFSHLVFTTGFETGKLVPEISEYSKTIRGQLSTYQTSAEIDTVVNCGESMVISANDDTFYVGGTYDLDDDRPIIKQVDEQVNDQMLLKMNPNLKACSTNLNKPFVGVRLTSTDTLPFVGQLANREKFYEDYKYLEKNARKPIENTTEYLPTLYINAALGSKGMIYAYLNAEIIKSLILNAPVPISYSAMNAINPARFMIRQLKSNKFRL